MRIEITCDRGMTRDQITELRNKRLCKLFDEHPDFTVTDLGSTCGGRADDDQGFDFAARGAGKIGQDEIDAIAKAVDSVGLKLGSRSTDVSVAVFPE